jgi:hypothetical protein
MFTTDTIATVQSQAIVIDGKALDTSSTEIEVTTMRFTDLNWVGGGTLAAW